jgi:hypothetical protein
VHWRANDLDMGAVAMQAGAAGPAAFEASLSGLSRGARISFYIEAADTSGKRKTAPIRAPHMTIDLVM